MGGTTGSTFPSGNAYAGNTMSSPYGGTGNMNFAPTSSAMGNSPNGGKPSGPGGTTAPMGNANSGKPGGPGGTTAPMGNANSGKPGGSGGQTAVIGQANPSTNPAATPIAGNLTAPPAGSTSTGKTLPAGATPTGVPAGMTAGTYGGSNAYGQVNGYNSYNPTANTKRRMGAANTNSSPTNMNLNSAAETSGDMGTSWGDNGQGYQAMSDSQIANMTLDQYNAAMQAMLAGPGQGLAGKMQNAHMNFDPYWHNTAVQRGYFTQRAKAGGLMSLIKR